VHVEWIRQLSSPATEWGQSSTIDELGNVYVSGFTHSDLLGQNQGGEDAFIVKYSPDGNLEWAHQFGTSQSDSSSYVSGDGLGNVYLAGITGGAIGGANVGSNDVFVRKYDNNGNELWTRQIGTTTSDDCTGIATDKNGNVFFSGVTIGNLGGTHAGTSTNWDDFIGLYDADGNLKWIRQFGGKYSDFTFGVAADGIGNAYLAGDVGVTQPPPLAATSQSFVRKYDASGALVWNSDAEFEITITADASGNTYAAGGSFIDKRNTQGDLLWSRSGDGYVPRSLVTDKLGNLYGEGYKIDDAGKITNVFVSGYDSDGNALWTELLGTTNSDQPLGISVDSQGNVYITGFQEAGQASPDVYIAKISTAPLLGDFNNDGIVDTADLCGLA
jgi:hypothetical protein